MNEEWQCDRCTLTQGNLVYFESAQSAIEHAVHLHPSRVIRFLNENNPRRGLFLADVLDDVIHRTSSKS